MKRFAADSVAVCLFAGLVAACAGQPGTARQTALTIEAKEFKFSPSTIELVAGQPAQITLKNTGTLAQDFSVMEIPMEGTAIVTAETVSGHDMGAMTDQPALHMAAANGQVASLSFTPSKPGTYMFFCTVTGHKQAGMTGTLTVKAQ